MSPTLANLFFLKRIYFYKTYIAIAVEGWYGLLGLFVLIAFAHLTVQQLLPFIAISLYFLVRTLLRTIIVRRRTKTVRRIAQTDAFQSAYAIGAVASKTELPATISLLAQGLNWRQYESQTIYRSGGKNKYDSKMVYYTVFEIKLCRTVPNIIFDSKSAKGQQFRYDYVNSQKISLEGNFDNYFQTYTPDYYEVDSLSFISPEVMQALIHAKDYDIELTADRLLLYGPVIFSTKDLEIMQAIGLDVARHLDDNLDTYTDSYAEGRHKRYGTTAFARQLLKSPLKSLIGSSIGALILGALIIFGIRTDTWIGETFVYAGAFFITCLIKAMKTIRWNKKITASFRAS